MYASLVHRLGPLCRSFSIFFSCLFYLLVSALFIVYIYICVCSIASLLVFLSTIQTAEKEAEERRQMESGELLACHVGKKRVRIGIHDAFFRFLFFVSIPNSSRAITPPPALLT